LSRPNILKRKLQRHPHQPRARLEVAFRIASSLLAIGLLAGEEACRSPVQAQADARPHFAPDSFWYKPIPRDAPLNANSAAYVQEFLRQLHAYYGTVGINATSFSSPVYTVGPGTKLQPVTQWDCHKSGYTDPGLVQQWGAVPIPDDAQPAGGSDAEMTIYQPSADRLWEFWQLRRVGGSWQACWGGGMQNVSQNPGIWSTHYGASATGLPYAAGQVTLAELESGAINHVMGIALVDTERASVLSWPANRSDGYNPNNAPNRIPEGLRFRLDPSVNVDSLNLHPVAKIIAKAAQTYGFVVWDKAGSISLRFENPAPAMKNGASNPYTPLFNGTPSYKALAGVPWDKLQFLPVNYGQP